MQLLTPAEILTLLAIGVCLLAGVWAVFSSLGRGRGPVRRGAREAAAHGQVACGACGHAADPQATTCPECGTPYALAGTATPALLVRTGAPAWLTAILLAVPAITAAILLHAVVYRAIPMVATPAPPASASRDALIELTPSRGGGGPSTYTLAVQVDVNGDERTTGAPPNERHDFVPSSGQGQLFVEVGGQQRVLLVHDFQADHWTVYAPQNRSSITPSAGTGLDAGVAALFAEAGLDQRPFADAEMHEAVQWLTYTHGGEPPNGFAAVGPASESSGPSDTALRQSGLRSESLSYGTIVAPTVSPSPLARPAGIAAAGVPILAWIVGLALLVRARRRVLRAGAPAGTQGP